MLELVVKIGVNAVALIAAAKLIPEINLPIPNNFDRPEAWGGILVIALVFALVNSYIKPIVKALALPIGILTMGLVSFVINAAMLLGTAWVVDKMYSTLHVTFQVGGFPPHWGYEAIGVAVIGSIVISIVSTVLEIALVPRRALF